MSDAQYRTDREEVIAETIDAAEEVHDPLDDLVEKQRPTQAPPLSPCLELLAIRRVTATAPKPTAQRRRQRAAE